MTRIGTVPCQILNLLKGLTLERKHKALEEVTDAAGRWCSGSDHSKITCLTKQ